MLSAFSFGKIIKTFLPGTILCAAILLLLEAVSQSIKHCSIVPVVANKDVVVATTAVLLPISLLLGFVLNTVVWLVVNRWIARPLAHWRLEKSDTFKKLRAGLAEKLCACLKSFAKDELRQIDREFESLEYFYLPVVTLERHNLVWESYFSWYEFQANTALAVLLLAAALIFYLCVKPLKAPHEFWACFLTIAISILGTLTLMTASIMNLAEFERKLLILIAGSLQHESQGESKHAAPIPW